MDLGIFATFLTINIPGSSQVDFAFGAKGIVLTGKEKTPNEFGPDFIADVSSFLFAPSLRGEWFATQHLAFHTQVGVVFSILSENANAFKTNDINIQMFQASDLLGQAGFTFYF